jgi:hypothetical protein
MQAAPPRIERQDDFMVSTGWWDLYLTLIIGSVVSSNALRWSLQESSDYPEKVMVMIKCEA